MSWIFIALMGLLALFLPCVFAGPMPSVTLTGSMEQPVFREGQPVVLALTLHSNGKDRLIIGGRASEASSFQITITDKAGHLVPRTALGERILMPPPAWGSNSICALAPGQTRLYRFNLARLFDLSRAGTYTINVSRRLRPQILPQEINVLSPPVSKPTLVTVPPAIETPLQEITLTTDHLTVHMTDGNAAVSGSTAYAPPSGHQVFLYMASRYNPGVSRDRVGTDGSVSFSYDPSAPGSGAPTPAPALGAGPDALVATSDGHYLYTNGSFLLAPDGTVSELPLPAFRPLSPRVGNNNAIALSPSGKFAFVVSRLIIRQEVSTVWCRCALKQTAPSLP